MWSGVEGVRDFRKEANSTCLEEHAPHPPGPGNPRNGGTGTREPSFSAFRTGETAMEGVAWTYPIGRLVLPLFLFSQVACSPPVPSVAALRGQQVESLAGPIQRLDGLMGPVATVFITLDPECPFCRLYAHDLQATAVTYGDRGVGMVGLYTGPYMDTANVRRFSAEAGFTFPQVMDPDCRLGTALSARVTPEVFLTDAEGTVVYKGSFDDRAVREGRKKYTAQRHYLADAIEAFLRDGSSSPEVEAVGCIVECDEVHNARASRPAEDDLPSQVRATP